MTDKWSAKCFFGLKHIGEFHPYPGVSERVASGKPFMKFLSNLNKIQNPVVHFTVYLISKSHVFCSYDKCTGCSFYLFVFLVCVCVCLP